MNEKTIVIESVPLQEVAAALGRTHPFADVDLAALPGVERVERLTVPAGAVLIEPGAPWSYYWLILQGEVRAERGEPDGTWTLVTAVHGGEAFGEAPLLTGRTHSVFRVTASTDAVLVRFRADDFWALLACCPTARKVILADVAQRMQAYQVEALHREKLVSLGTLAAGLMHELHNPGSAAKRAASQLRENLLRMQQLSLRSSSHPKTPQQLDCIKGLLEHAVSGCRMKAMGSLEQADAEEEMGQWLTSAGVENAYSIGPVLVGMGFERNELACAREFFDAPSFSDALNWLGSLVSSVTLVCAIEESISRISDLVMAVKKFAYDERSAARELDVHDSLQSTLTILGHKLRLKRINVEKRFAASPSVIQTRGSALSQVWTNLIDNAADASAESGQIEIATWTEPDMNGAAPRLAVSIADHGSGISPDVLPHIFEAFFTTKTQGSGTGLGLEIVHRIVTQKFGGSIDVESEPGRTVFTVRLPMKVPAQQGT
ncbi:MAG TPA: ATP-binding protein [Terracidiphilus sp.]|nr:ATP-binding protein [Terracidiphilus sp.]